MLLYPFAVVVASLADLDNAQKTLGDMAPTYFVAVAGIVAAFFAPGIHEEMIYFDLNTRLHPTQGEQLLNLEHSFGITKLMEMIQIWILPCWKMNLLTERFAVCFKSNHRSHHDENSGRTRSCSPC